MAGSMNTKALFVALIILCSLQWSTSKYSYKENAVPEPVKLNPRLQELFAKTKLLCFGRYAIQVPQEAKLNWGSATYRSRIEVIDGGLDASKRQIIDDIAKLKWDDETAEITYNNEGPIKNSWQIRYYKSRAGKELGLHMFKTYVNKGDLTFMYRDSVNKNGTEDSAATQQAERATSLRLLSLDEIPNEPGFCVEHAFMSGNGYSDQEMVSAGIYLPSLPDVTFSINSNKDAYGDYPPAEFEKTKRAKLSLLARIAQAKEDQGIGYPSRTLLREGKRNVQHWRGEESLIRRKDGAHDFEWALVGTPRDVANPSEFSARMYTKVEHDTVGAAKAASLTDDEAVALWDKLLSGLKFRVKVPGAPPGSYFLPSDKPDVAQTGK
jgi:hypothetical protein